MEQHDIAYPTTLYKIKFRAENKQVLVRMTIRMLTRRQLT